MSVPPTISAASGQAFFRFSMTWPNKEKPLAKCAIRPSQPRFGRRNFKPRTEHPPATRTKATTPAPTVRLPVRCEAYPNSTEATRLPIWPTLLMNAMQPGNSFSERKPVGMVQNRAMAER
jgi:hypothetical protein